MPQGSSSPDAVQPDDPGGRTPARGARPGSPRRAASAARPPRSWPAFTRALAGVLAVLEDEQSLVLPRKQGGGYVQVAALGDGELRVEAVSNHYLSGSARLDRARIRRLRQLGWLPPTHAPDRPKLTKRERKGSPNFYRDLAGEVDYAATAELLVATLREVCGVGSPGRLAYTAFELDGREILLPTLGIDREPCGTEPKKQPAPRRPESAGQLRAFVLEALQEWTGKSGMEFDQDGDLALSRGDVSVLVRVDPKAPFVDTFSTVLYGVEPGLDLSEALNERNNAARCVVLTLMGTRVVASVSVDASTFVPELLGRALGALADAVDESRVELRPRFGGRIAFDDDPAPRPDTGAPGLN